MAKKDWMIKESELDDDQIKVLNATLDKSLIATGCAGSGKSVLALVKAQRIQKEKGNDYQIIVYTKALCNYMNAGRESLGLTKLFDYHWVWKNRKHCPQSDYVIVDEIQDFTKEEILEFVNSARKNFFFFGDSAQSIYDGMPQKDNSIKRTMPVEDIRDILPDKKNVKTMELYRNYRLPVTVARLVQTVGVDIEVFDEDTYKSKENSIPRIVKFVDLKAQIDAIVNIIKNQSLNDVGILLPHNADVGIVSDILNQKGCNHEAKFSSEGRNIETLNFSTDNPKVMTWHSAKGLQFETVFLPYIRELDVRNARTEQKALYVAMTRTYKYLYIFYSGVLPKPLSDIPEDLYKTTLVDEIEDI